MTRTFEACGRDDAFIPIKTCGYELRTILMGVSSFQCSGWKMNGCVSRNSMNGLLM